MQPLLAGVLLLLGAGFFVANVRMLLQYARFLKRRPQALLIWPAPTPQYYGLTLVLGAALGILVLVKFWMRQQTFGETMMLVYFAMMQPLSLRIRRGFYQDGIWADTGFIQYNEVGGISWREGEHDVTLIVISRL